MPESQENSQQPEIVSVNELVKKQIIGELDKYHVNNPIENDRQKEQKEIIGNLPNDFYLEIQAIRNLPDSDDGTVAGYVFEEIVRSDKRICTSKETPLANTLRGFMHNPERYALENIHPVKNPDLARINDQGKITGWVEVKSGKLDSRAVQQLVGFEYSFGETLRKLKILSLRTLKEHGLSVIADNVKNLELDVNLKKTLAVTNDAYQGRFEDLVVPGQLNHITQKQKEVLLNQYKVAKSPFSRAELGVLTNLLVQMDKDGRRINSPA